MGQHLGFYTNPIDNRGAQLQFLAVMHGQHFELHPAAFFHRKPFHIQECTFLHPVLLPAGLNYGILIHRQRGNIYRHCADVKRKRKSALGLKANGWTPEPIRLSFRRMTGQETRIVLASSSPRRRELLSALGVSFEVLPPAVEEQPLPGETPAGFALRAAREKAEAARQRLDAADRRPVLIIAADTVVVSEGRILGKPADADEAVSMLRSLSGREHVVITGVYILLLRNGRIEREELYSVRTVVLFRELDENEIRAYVSTGEPLDKAGAYAAQGIGRSLIRRVEGSYTNVVGLPLAEVAQSLKRFGIPFLTGFKPVSQ